MQSFASLPDIGEKASLYTLMNVREDDISLFGFVTLEVKKLFILLTSISKVGPKMALAILSGLDVKSFEKAVVSGDVVKIKGIPGIGLKTAERIILELKDKFDLVFKTEVKPDDNSEDVVSALCNLGYSRKDAENAVRVSYSGENSFEENLKKALRGLSG
ncbi:MAG: Holliday junction branch migration protein RuvA [Geovibrio sp.]|nr:Holliday junction branch migration protein RuvA [Geovibrio sp.]